MLKPKTLTDYPDQWLDIKPGASGGQGRPRMAPAAKLSTDGQLVLNHAASELLGNPARVKMQANPHLERIRLTPTTPNDNGGFALSGGGNAQCRISCREMMREYPELAGSYKISKFASGVLLVREDV